MLNVTLIPRSYKIEQALSPCDYFIVYNDQLDRWCVEMTVNNRYSPDKSHFLCWLDRVEKTGDVLKISDVFKPRCDQTAYFHSCDCALKYWKSYANRFHLPKHYKYRVTVEVTTNPLQTPPEVENFFDASKFWQMRIISSETVASWNADTKDQT